MPAHQQEGDVEQEQEQEQEQEPVGPVPPEQQLYQVCGWTRKQRDTCYLLCVASFSSTVRMNLTHAPTRDSITHQYQVHTGAIHPPINTITHMGIVGLVHLAKSHDVGLLLGTLQWT